MNQTEDIMDKYFIGTLNNISQKGLCRLTDKFELTDDIDKANGIILIFELKLLKRKLDQLNKVYYQLKSYKISLLEF